TAAGENYFRCAAAEQVGYRFARVLDRSPSLLSVMMDGRGISEAFPEKGAHGFEHLGQNRGGGVVVEVNAMHTEPTSILRDSCAGCSWACALFALPGQPKAAVPTWSLLPLVDGH